MRNGARQLLRVLTCPLVLACLLLLGCEEEQEAGEIVRPVRAMKVQNVEGFVKRYFPGRAAATQEINAAFRVSGQLLERPIDVGTEVKNSDVIAQLDTSTFEAEVSRLKGEVAAADSTRERAQLELNRQSELLSKGWVTKARVETVRATTLAARASLISAQAALKRAELDLSYTTLTAPFDGVVAETFVENFQEVLAKQPVVRIVDTSQIEFWVSIPESLISTVPYARDITVEFDAFPDQPLPAQVKEIKSEASETTRSYDVNLIMDQPESFTVLPGMAGKAVAGRFDLPAEDQVEGYEVPLAAIHNPGGDKDYVWVVDEGSMTVSMREIKTIEPSDRGLRVEGVKPGEWIVIAGVEYLRDGQEVRFFE